VDLLDFFRRFGGKGGGGDPSAMPAGDAPEDPARAAAREVLAQFDRVARGPDTEGHVPMAVLDAAHREAEAAVLAAPIALQAAVLREAVREAGAVDSRSAPHWAHLRRRAELVSALARRPLPLTDREVAALIADAARLRGTAVYEVRMPYIGLLRLVARHGETAGLTDEVRGSLRTLHASLAPQQHSDYTKVCARIETMLGTREAAVNGVASGEAWSDAALDLLSSLGAESSLGLRQLLEHAETASSAKPTAKFMKIAEERLELAGRDFARETLIAWLTLAASPGTAALQRGSRIDVRPDTLDKRNTTILRGLAFTASLVDDGEVARALGGLADASFRKVPSFGPLRPVVGNACVEALSRMSCDGAASEIARLTTRVKHASIRKRVAGAFDRAAESRGVTTGDLEELAVPTHGLDSEGLLRVQAGPAIAEIRLDDAGEVAIRWLRGDGKSQATVPEEAKREAPGVVKSVRAGAKDVERTWAAQRARLERDLRRDPVRDLATWRARTLGHPVVGRLARRLIWTLETESGDIQAVPSADGGLLGLGGAPEAVPDDGTRVRLWHPHSATPDTVHAWRRELERREITQPFKQAHREVYLLTPAERETERFSLRFASHRLRQHQLAALCRERGWSYALQGAFDGANDPTIELEGGFRAWIEARTSEVRGAPQSASGIDLEVTTGALHLHGPGAVRLADVPPRLFSEVLRDVDLFVGVCSLGTDPDWVAQQQGLGGALGWREMLDADLSETALTRRATLESLVPKLRIAPQCSFEAKCLVVRGKLGTYRIHLGSGNILRERDSRYLCIVAKGASPADRVRLPYEGDAMLSVILSKAFLLASDDTITDPAILGQL
jgi:hypothetical protein